jgi:hypothetical protein
MRKRVESEQPEGPARIGDGHVCDRVISPVAGAARAWRKLSPLEAAYAKGQLAGGRFTAQQRFEAGQRYARLFAACESSGRDSTQLLNISRSYNGAPLGESQRGALEKLRSLHAAMGANDAAIVRLVCGEGHTPAESVRRVCGEGYKDATLARFREALDGLVRA